jgi:hypothetical protein
MKYSTFAEYDPRGLALAEPALLTVWSGIGSYHEELVLVGGLVPQYLCRHPVSDSALPRPGTLDVDLGIALGATAGQYGSLSADLKAQGFRPSEKFPTRFEKQIGIYPVYIDFLVERMPAMQGTAMVDDIPANILPGIDRALATARLVTISGTDLFGAQQKLTVRVCEVGTFLVLKLRAFARRQQPKDAFDILYTLMHYDRGLAVATAAFAEEGVAKNPAFAEALECLKSQFQTENAPGPVRASYFVFGEVLAGESEDMRLRRLQVQQDAVSLAAALLAAAR